MGERLTDAALVAYRAAGALVRPLVPLALAARARRGKEDAVRRSERYGHATLERPAGPLVWVHAASVGETNAVVPLLERLTQDGFRILFTSTTVTSSRVAAARLPAGALHQFGPVDVVAYVDRFLDHWRPDLAILVESELWPGAISRLHARRIATVVVNARLSARTFNGWNRISAVARGLFARIALVLAQSEEDAERFRRLGVRNVRVAGNLKSDAPPLAADPVELARIRDAAGQRPVWVAASTHEGEEAVVAEVHRRLRGRFPDLL
ncbi:MAG TPA: glycosyltransferase N-terminal domain-containing protein, partial [Bauldia sp.]|nr:glycosyltransferase N-terminal domain-containing protein [Bauldia sp.]